MPVQRPRTPLRLLSALAVVGLLAGCGALSRQAPPETAQSVSPHPEVTTTFTARLPAPKPEVPETARRPVTATIGVAAIGVPPRPPRRPAFPRVGTDAFAGLTAEGALAIFGKPARAVRGPAGAPTVTSWIYERAGCRLEIAFHFSVADNALIAHAYDVGVSQPGAVVPESICLHALAEPPVRVARRPDAG